jgi:6-phosphogluconolactonase (cycloisomerase 2 family)
VQVVALPGQPGPHRIEQVSSHPHHVVFDPGGRSLIVPDKGLDRVFIFRFDATSGKLTPTEQGAAIARAGSGPRHAAFHPRLPIAWVVNEIASTVTTYFWDAERGSLRPVQFLPTLPPDYTGENTTAEIAVSAGGRFVCCSNRGHDSIAVFAIDAVTGTLTPVEIVSTRGIRPRGFAIDPSGRYLFVANVDTQNVIEFKIDSLTGRLTPTGTVLQVPYPNSVRFAPAR